MIKRLGFLLALFYVTAEIGGVVAVLGYSVNSAWAGEPVEREAPLSKRFDARANS